MEYKKQNNDWIHEDGPEVYVFLCYDAGTDRH